MAHYDKYRKYHEALINTDFSELSNIIVQVESSSNNYKNLVDMTGSIDWEGKVQSALFSKIKVLSNSTSALQNEILVNVSTIVDVGKQLLEVLADMKINQENYDGSNRTIYELKKKLYAANKAMEETSEYDPGYIDIRGNYLSIKNKYEYALSKPQYYQSIIDELAVKADELIKKLQSISFSANIDGILSEEVVYENRPEETFNLSYIITIDDSMKPNDILKIINEMKEKVKREYELLENYYKQLNKKFGLITVQIMTLRPGSPEYMEACQYQSELLNLKNSIEKSYKERLDFYNTLDKDTYGGIILLGWGKSEFCSALQKGDTATINTYIDQYNSSSKEFVSLEKLLTPKYSEILENVSIEIKNGKYVDNSLIKFARKNKISEVELLSGEHNDLLREYVKEYNDSFIMFSEKQGVGYEDSAFLKYKIQEAYIGAAVRGDLENVEPNIQRFSMNDNNKIYTYEYNTLDKTYTLMSINADGNVNYFDGSLG